MKLETALQGESPEPFPADVRASESQSDEMLPNTQANQGVAILIGAFLVSMVLAVVAEAIRHSL